MVPTTAADETTPLVSNTSESQTRLSRTVFHGYVFMFFSAVCQALMSLFTHNAEVQYKLPVPTLLLVRAVFAIILPLLFLTFTRSLHVLVIQRSTLLTLIPCGFIAAGNGIILYFALSFAPAGIVVTMNYTAPVFTSILAALFFGESFTLLHAGTIVGNLLGVALVAQHPTSSSVPQPHHHDSPFASSSNYTLGVVLGLASAGGVTLLALGLKRLGSSVHPVLLTLAYGVAAFAYFPLIAREGDVAQLWTNIGGVLCAVACSFAGSGIQVFLSMGIRRAPTGPAVVVRSLAVPLVLVLSWLVLGEGVALINLLGIVLVLASVITIGLIPTLLSSPSRGEMTSQRHSAPPVYDEPEDEQTKSSG